MVGAVTVGGVVAVRPPPRAVAEAAGMRVVMVLPGLAGRRDARTAAGAMIPGLAPADVAWAAAPAPARRPVPFPMCTVSVGMPQRKGVGMVAAIVPVLAVVAIAALGIATY